MYINTEALDYPLTLRQVRQSNPNVSLPKQPDEETLSALGFATVQPAERPTGDVVTEGTPEKQQDGTWRQTWDVRSYTDDELAQREQERLSRLFTYKTDIWQRCTINEAEQLDAALESASAKEKRMWNDSITIEHSSDYYTILKQQMESQFGADRTAELLAPSNGGN